MAPNAPIICIEDDTDDQFIMELAAKELNISRQLRFFSDGESAIHYLETSDEQPFLILCDMNLPGINGLELRQRLNDNEYLRRKSVPFVFLTTGASSETVDKAYAETVQGFFQKTPDYNKFKRQLEVLIAYWEECLHPNTPFFP